MTSIIDDTEFFDSIAERPPCEVCRHLMDFNDRRCLAFDKIPDEIWSGGNPHKMPIKGDNGVQFEDILTNEGRV